MNIVQLITELLPGGAERVLVDLCLGLARRGHQVKVVALRPFIRESVIINELRNAGIPVLNIGLRKLMPWRLLYLRKLLTDIHPDIVHSHLFHANIVSRLNGFKRDYKLINTVHTMESRQAKRWYFWIDGMTLQWCDVQTAVSAATRNFHAEHLRINPDDMPVIYNGIVTPKKLFENEITQLRKEWGVAHCSAVIGSVGRLGYEKGYDLLFDALPPIADKIPAGQNWGIVIIGEGAEREKLEKLAKNAPSSIKICLPGFRRDAAECIGAFDLFIMPSRYEGFGLALIEAMSHGLQIIASEIGPLQELLKGYANGQFVNFKKHNTALLAEKIAKVISQPTILQPDLSFTSDKMVEKYLELYTSLLPHESQSCDFYDQT